MPSVADKTASAGGDSNPSKEDYPVEPYTRPPTTKEALDYAPLVEIDVSKFDEPGERQRLAAQLEDAVRNVGFWIVTGHGIPDEEVLRQLSFANAFFHSPLENKQKVKIDLGKDYNFEYREPNRVYGDTGLRETLETYEIHKGIEAFKDVPINPLLKAHWDEISAFNKKLYDQVLSRLYVLIAIMLELPEDYFLKITAYERSSEDKIRYMSQKPHTREEHAIIQANGIGGHADFGCLTLLQSQNVCGLQMLTREGDWKWVKPVPGGITVNAGETLAIKTKNFVKATIHRVAPPPDDQLQYERLGLIYFSQLNHGVSLKPVPSDKLKRLGMLSDADLASDDYPTAEEYSNARRRSVHHVKSYAKRDRDAKFEIKGVTVQSHYD